VNDAVTYLAEIPSPTQGVWHLWFIPIRAYALCILVGIVVACVITEVRMRRRGAPPWLVLDIAVWAVPFGILGARIYHVITSPDDYFGTNGDPMQAFAIWNGGLGIWGAVAGGALGAWIACRLAGIPLTFVADALAPGLPVAQAIGRLGNWFNNELYGASTNLPWGLRIYDYELSEGHAKLDPATGEPIVKAGSPFHPTFLYELVWNLGVALLVWLVDRRWKLGRGRAFALYVMGYTVGRFWIEAMRRDEAHSWLGLRVNGWVSIVVFLGALVYFLRVRGPQENLRAGEDGKLVLVTADGTPIPWKGAKVAADSTGSSSTPQAAEESPPESDADASAEATDDDERVDEAAPAEKK